ncbi:uncharacterized protein TNIN_257401 [Trichonephila inaurata madagascariensis]|uniref:Gustatory receptor n=1 Tax=Trichonephila inaurata madagascariensis TaxID=2747483 RepID=A0A8X6MKK7_9ARAC|nr:uncharacterized protein TNIN_257401 [Trichonephila inaurata madagascariensis]
MESFKRSSYSFNVNNYSFSNSAGIVPRFPGHIAIILKLFAVFGIDIILPTKGKKSRIINKVSVIVYRCTMSLIMLYCLAARLYKASQPHVPLMLAFSESVATACSVVIRFTILLNKSSIVKIVRSLQKTEGTRTPSQIRQEKALFRFGTGGVLFALCLSVTKAAFELRSAAGFQLYKKAYLFSPQMSNQTLIFTAPNVFVCTSHVFYIANLYGVPGLSLMFCCVLCQNVTFFLRDSQTKVKECFESGEPQKIWVRNIIFYLRKMRSLVNKTENALSPILFFLYGYLLCSLFYLVSLTIRTKRGLEDMKRIYIAASFLTLISFYLLLSILVVRVYEAFAQTHNTVLQAIEKSPFYSADAATLMIGVREFTRDTKITGWGVFVIDRSFLLTSVGMVITYGVILAQFS